MSRNSDEVIADLKVLIRKPGYIYSLCLILFEDFHHDMNKMHEIDHRSNLSVKECSLILGFLVQHDIDFSFPQSPQETFERKEKTYALMEELHFSFLTPQMHKLHERLKMQEKGEVLEDERKERLDFFAKDKGMIEPMFYAGEGVYDFQYMEYLQPKYKYDREWLKDNKGFELDVVPKIVKTIKQLLTDKAYQVLPINIKEAFPEVAAKARKKLRKHYSKTELDKIEREQYIAASFYRYHALFPDPDNWNDDNTEGWRLFYQNLLELFVIQPADLKGFKTNTLNHFFANFSFLPGDNTAYEGPGYYNILNSRPFIHLGKERYFLPIGFLLPEAIYESPFYWMTEDASYRTSLAKHRGDVGEEIAYEWLSKVFGAENTFRSIQVESKKGKRETDIDVLCLLGNKALCVQVKSKKLTLTAKRGNFEQLLIDFKGAVQDAYDQGLKSRSAILEQKFKFKNQQGEDIYLPREINEVYIMGLTTENYPSLAHQLYLMLDKKPEDPYPLFVSAFDLELLTHYLKDPYDFLYYIRQRIALMDYFRADEELVYLGYHLDQKLWPREGASMVAIETDFGKIIDRNYYPYKTGIAHLLPEKDDPIENRWKDPQFDHFIQAIKHTGHSKATDIVFHLLDWSGATRKNIVARMIQLKEAAKTEHSLKSLATYAGDFGLSYVVTANADPEELEFRVTTYARLRKYLTKSNSWLGLGAFSANNRLIDALVYLDEPWEADPEFEEIFADELASLKKTPFTSMKGNSKIGRNDPCPCQSGKKFKKCCGRNT